MLVRDSIGDIENPTTWKRCRVRNDLVQKFGRYLYADEEVECVHNEGKRSIDSPGQALQGEATPIRDRNIRRHNAQGPRKTPQEPLSRAT